MKDNIPSTLSTEILREMKNELLLFYLHLLFSKGFDVALVGNALLNPNVLTKVI